MSVLAYLSTRDHEEGWFNSLAPLCGRDVLSLWNEYAKAATNGRKKKGTKSTGNAELDAFAIWANGGGGQ